MRLLTRISIVFLLFTVGIACSTSRPVDEASTSSVKATIEPMVEHKLGSSGCIETGNRKSVACGGQSSDCIESGYRKSVACGGDPQSNPNRNGDSQLEQEPEARRR